MNRITAALVCIVLLTVASCGNPAPPATDNSRGGADKGADEIDIVGQYTYEQKLPDGGAEKGTVEVKRRGDTYTVVWVREDKGTYSGVGIRTGDLLSVCYSYAGDGERGVLVYKITKGPKLTGQWATLGGDGKLYPDTWTPKK